MDLDFASKNLQGLLGQLTDATFSVCWQNIQNFKAVHQVYIT